MDFSKRNGVWKVFRHLFNFGRYNNFSVIVSKFLTKFDYSTSYNCAIKIPAAIFDLIWYILKIFVSTVKLDYNQQFGTSQIFSL